MKRKLLHIFAMASILAISSAAKAQVDFQPIFTQMRLEARADFDYFSVSNDYGFHGRYFNMIIGGPLNDKFSYFFRQRIVASPGSVNFFDNTDFLYLNFTPNEHWMIRMGKDALAVGGFEYDAPPINVLFSTQYWDNFYCFQPALAAAYKYDNNKQMMLLQIANSPYVYYGADLGYGVGSEWRSGLMAYSLFYSGSFGHLSLLHSVNMFQRPDRKFMNYIALGHKLTYDKWDLYLDLIHHANAANDWMNNYAVVSCANYYLNNGLNFFVKGAYEQNHSNEVIPGFGTRDYDLGAYDCLIKEGTSIATYGVGMEYHPKSCPDFRLHAFVANRTTTTDLGAENSQSVNSQLQCNVGITWDMNVLKMFRERRKIEQQIQ